MRGQPATFPIAPFRTHPPVAVSSSIGAVAASSMRQPALRRKIIYIDIGRAPRLSLIRRTPSVSANPVLASHAESSTSCTYVRNAPQAAFRQKSDATSAEAHACPDHSNTPGNRAHLDWKVSMQAIASPAVQWRISGGRDWCNCQRAQRRAGVQCGGGGCRGGGRVRFAGQSCC
jgi:hypothetical protein